VTLLTTLNAIAVPFWGMAMMSLAVCMLGARRLAIIAVTDRFWSEILGHAALNRPIFLQRRRRLMATGMGVILLSVAVSLNNSLIGMAVLVFMLVPLCYAGMDFSHYVEPAELLHTIARECQQPHAVRRMESTFDTFARMCRSQRLTYTVDYPRDALRAMDQTMHWWLDTPGLPPKARARAFQALVQLLVDFRQSAMDRRLGMECIRVCSQWIGKAVKVRASSPDVSINAFLSLDALLRDELRAITYTPMISNLRPVTDEILMVAQQYMDYEYLNHAEALLAETEYIYEGLVEYRRRSERVEKAENQVRAMRAKLSKMVDNKRRRDLSLDERGTRALHLIRNLKETPVPGAANEAGSPENPGGVGPMLAEATAENVVPFKSKSSEDNT
jgi:hypothetical protein